MTTEMTKQDPSRQRDQNHTTRLKIDRLPRDPIKFADGRTVALLWGREISPTGKPLGFQRVKLWNGSAKALMSILRSRNVSEKNPMTVDLTGFLKPDYKDANKKVLDAQIFKIVGEPDIARNKARAAGSAETSSNAPEQERGDSNPTAKNFEQVKAIVIDLVEDDNGKVEIIAMMESDWQNTAIDRNKEANMFRVSVAPSQASAVAAIREGANWNGYYMDLDEPVATTMTGAWTSVDPKHPDASRYHPEVFVADAITITAAPNMPLAKQPQTSQRRELVPPKASKQVTEQDGAMSI